MTPQQSLRLAIDTWVSENQEDDDQLKMWISPSLAESMASAAWAVLVESRKTQRWLKKEGMDL